jgi:hypothetical protein
MKGQLDLFAPAEHVVQVYVLPKGLWGVDKAIKQQPWWAWRCSCGRDVGAEQRCAYSGRAGAEQMAEHHARDSAFWEGWK